MKAKLAGCDGDIDQLLVNTWFEETKISDLGSRSTTRRSVSIPECTSTPSKDTSAGGRQAFYRAKDTCHGCEETGHHIHQCAYNQMSQRRPKLHNNAATLVPGSKTLEEVTHLLYVQ